MANSSQWSLKDMDPTVLVKFPGMGHIWRLSMPKATIDRKPLRADHLLQMVAKNF